ncbi:MAG TPA: hypothetical protein DIT55_03860 [Spirochaetaceae bacterium]|nr:hypothetical protein [Spirochaetaceae bacterium]
MVALAVGIVLVVASVLMCLPGLLGWWGDVLAFLRGSIPVLAVLIGAVAILIGVADIKDKKEAEKEEREEAKAEEKSEEKPEAKQE